MYVNLLTSTLTSDYPVPETVYVAPAVVPTKYVDKSETKVVAAPSTVTLAFVIVGFVESFA